MEIGKGYSSNDYHALDLTTPSSGDWDTAIEIFKSRIYPRYIEPIDLLIASDSERNPRERKFGFTIMAIACLLIETLYCFRRGILDNKGNGKPTFVEYLSTSPNLSPYFGKGQAAIFYDHIRNGILHQAETKYDSRIRSVGPVARVLPNGLAVNRTILFDLLKKDVAHYIFELSDPANEQLRQLFRDKMDFISKK